MAADGIPHNHSCGLRCGYGAGCVRQADVALDAPQFGVCLRFRFILDLPHRSDEDFLSLLPVFLIVSAVVAITTGNEGASVQRASWRTPRAIDFRGVQGTLTVSGLAALLSGIAGTIPTIIYLPSTAAFIGFTSGGFTSGIHKCHTPSCGLRDWNHADSACSAAQDGGACADYPLACIGSDPDDCDGVAIHGRIAEGFRTVLQDGLYQR